jgi:hypothetical protein
MAFITKKVTITEELKQKPLVEQIKKRARVVRTCNGRGEETKADIRN